MMRRLGRWVGALFSKRRRNLAGLEGPEAVLVEGRLASDNTIESPVTPVKAVILTAAILDEHVSQQRNTLLSGSSDDVVTYRIRSTVQLNGPFVVETDDGRVHVPQVQVKVDYLSYLDRNPVSLVRVPELFHDVVAQADDNRTKYYNEAFLCRGDPVTLRAVVRPNDPGGGPYRGGTSIDAEYVAVVEAELPTVIEDGSLI